MKQRTDAEFVSNISYSRTRSLAMCANLDAFSVSKVKENNFLLRSMRIDNHLFVNLIQ